MMSLWDALRMNMMISYQELVRTFPRITASYLENIIPNSNPSVSAAKEWLRNNDYDSLKLPLAIYTELEDKGLLKNN
ncbi:ydjO [Escherichia coli]|uniref:hypothetical protein n=1 Tax=Escherichia coli TaxID=562 RepID=UPI000DA54791|nr:hypothetical protein [Escherichia coli]SRY42020.1 ydjO [Escherichia coli]SRY76936.1 ydjO [Escherichia coli]